MANLGAKVLGNVCNAHVEDFNERWVKALCDIKELDVERIVDLVAALPESLFDSNKLFEVLLSELISYRFHLLELVVSLPQLNPQTKDLFHAGVFLPDDTFARGKDLEAMALTHAQRPLVLIYLSSLLLLCLLLSRNEGLNVRIDCLAHDLLVLEVQ